ncbi:MAG: guanylate kinase [Lachnospiraceae bacterium]|nr:guanylate kinase [Lachnospiraceae bacterium]
MNNRGVLTILSGFSGVGKGTLVKELLEKYDNYALSVSATTRSARPGEEDGKSYFFLSVPEFEKKIQNNELLEYAKYVNNYYGTPRKYVEDMLNDGKDVLLEIEIQGARQIKKIMPDALTIFVMPPSAQTLKERLVGRNTETMDVIEARLKRAVEESQGIEEYDCILVNDDLEKSVEKLHEIIQASHNHSFRNIKFIEEIREGVKVFSEGE